MKLLAKLETGLTSSIALGFIIGGTLLSLLGTFASTIAMPVVNWIFGDGDIASKTTVLVEPSADNLRGVTLAWGQMLDTLLSTVAILGVVWVVLYLHNNGKLNWPMAGSGKKRRK